MPTTTSTTSPAEGRGLTVAGNTSTLSRIVYVLVGVAAPIGLDRFHRVSRPTSY